MCARKVCEYLWNDCQLKEASSCDPDQLQLYLDAVINAMVGCVSFTAFSNALRLETLAVVDPVPPVDVKLGAPPCFEVEIEAEFDEDNPICIGSIHQAKGLEYDTVIVCEPFGGGGYTQDAEETRVFYVACSRAKTKLVFIFCGGDLGLVKTLQYMRPHVDLMNDYANDVVRQSERHHLLLQRRRNTVFAF